MSGIYLAVIVALSVITGTVNAAGPASAAQQQQQQQQRALLQAAVPSPEPTTPPSIQPSPDVPVTDPMPSNESLLSDPTAPPSLQPNPQVPVASPVPSNEPAPDVQIPLPSPLPENLEVPLPSPLPTTEPPSTEQPTGSQTPLPSPSPENLTPPPPSEGDSGGSSPAPEEPASHAPAFPTMPDNLTSPELNNSFTSPSPENLTSPSPDSKLTPPSPDSNLTSPAPNSNLTSPPPDSNLTSPPPDSNLTSPSPDAPSPSPTLEELLSSPSPQPATSPSPEPLPSPSPAPLPLPCGEPQPIVEPQPVGVPIPLLPSGQRPNFIVILTDDQGYDDYGLHNPQYVQTPNLDKLYGWSTRFDNYYVTPQCATTRAALLTARDYPKTSTLDVGGGFSHMSLEETTAAEIFSRAGYRTAHFGKWHNGESLGYEAYNGVGFHDSWSAPFGYAPKIYTHNGVWYKTTTGRPVESLLMDKAIDYVVNQSESGEPFFIYYAPYAIHNNKDGEGRAYRSYPPQYDELFTGPQYTNISLPTRQAWAYLKYLDDNLGRLFDQLESSGLRNSTYIMVTGDNGSDLLKDEWANKQARMPSSMSGSKSTVYEGGVRNSLAVSGPGVQAGVVDSTLVDVTDILPTMVDLAGIEAGSHLPWDGISFKHLLLTEDTTSVPADARRGDVLATEQQRDRMLFHLTRQCWSPNSVPLLGPDREVIKPQPLLDFEKGGVRGWTMKGMASGFERCLAVRHKEFKWVGETQTLYRLANGSHIEMPCTADPEAIEVAERLRSAAKAWWDSIIAVPHTFHKPTFYLGLGDWRVTNLVTEGAHDRTAGVTLLRGGADGFKTFGDRMCFKLQVVKAGTYDVVVFYTSVQWAIMKLQVGPYQGIKEGWAPIIVTLLPASNTMRGYSIGSITVTATSSDSRDEACLQLLDSPGMGRPIFNNLANIRLTYSEIQQEVTYPAPRPSPAPSSSNNSSNVTEPAPPSSPLPPPSSPPVDTNGSSAFPPAPSNYTEAPGNSSGSEPPSDPDEEVGGYSPPLPPAEGGDGLIPDIPADAGETNNNTAALPPSLNPAPPAESTNGTSGLRLGSQVAPADLSTPFIPPGMMTQASVQVAADDTATVSAAAAAVAATTQLTGVQVRVAVPAPGPDFMNTYRGLIDWHEAFTSQKSAAAARDAWNELRMQYHWPDGQTVLEHMWSPWDVEECPECRRIPL